MGRELTVKTEDALIALANEPENRTAYRTIARIAAERIAGQLLSGGVDERPDLAGIASDILKEHEAALPDNLRSRVAVSVIAIVERTLDDDEPSRVTTLFKDWQANGRGEGDQLYDAIQVSLAKRMRWALRKFNSLQPKVSPGDLFSDLYLRLQKSGLPDTLENRREFYLYCDTVLENLLLDKIRADGRLKRRADEVNLDEVISAIQNGGRDAGGKIETTPHTFIDLKRAIALLPEDLQDLVQKRYLWGISQSEYMSARGISRAKLDRDQRKALAALRSALTSGISSSSEDK